MMFKLVEKTSGPFMGRVWRCEEMTQQAAGEINAKIGVMKWEPCDENGKDGSNSDGDAAARPRTER